ncbi:hypothetical protein LOH54_12270 [Sulfurimonas sp. HSL-3221]|uniref:hypothetical protein n=1 Tax=Sulfurimonadaceae TaxID=2771471 RepID=UPI001E5E87C7|nr:hypothetical protein [Sulfurimonas sp. HSL-3221]UFS62409.1 hypothetical protein LOH54_12270 [Sulfurimonas sp. HSL-3221]
MLSWKIGKNVISELYYHGKNIIKPWGFETADSSAFFSLEEGVGWRGKTLSETYTYDDTHYRAELLVRMKEGLWALSVDDRIDGNCIDRRVEAVTQEDSVFMDFVMRFRFKKAFIEYAEIGGKRYFHNDTNIYYQYPVDRVLLKGSSFAVTISVLDKVVPEKMTPVIYVRDNRDEWVVHVRMVPEKWDKEVIKICTAWAGTRPLPQWISRPLLARKQFKKALWYRGERQPFKNRFVRRFLNLAAFAMVRVPKAGRLMWHVRMEIE